MRNKIEYTLYRVYIVNIRLSFSFYCFLQINEKDNSLKKIVMTESYAGIFLCFLADREFVFGFGN